MKYTDLGPVCTHYVTRTELGSQETVAHTRSKCHSTPA